MLAIDRLRLNLPIELAGRAEHIGRLVAEELAQYTFQELAWLDHIAVPAVVVTLELSDRQVAVQIARAIIDHLTNRQHSLSDLARGRFHA